MNTNILIVACISALAVVGHVIGGTAESASITPNQKDIKLTRNWKQSMCAFQMLSVDLLLVTVVLFFIALTDKLPFEYELTLFFSLMFMLWGVAWLIQLFWLKSELKTYLLLPHWVVWFVCSALLFFGVSIN